MAYLNITKGARAIHLKSGVHVLVEPGATVEVDETKIKRVAPGLVVAPIDLPEVPDELVEAIAEPEKRSARRPARRKAGDA